MDCSNSFWKVDKFDMLFLVFILIITLSLVTFAAEVEDVSTAIIYNISIRSSSNYFYESTGNSVRYFQLEKGYIYHLNFEGEAIVNVALSSSLPAVNVPYEYLSRVDSQFDYLATDDSFLYFSWAPGINFSITREPITSMGGTVQLLADDVGVNQFWEIFELAIPFVAVIVLAVLGFFFVSKLMKKSSKGDIKF